MGLELSTFHTDMKDYAALGTRLCVGYGHIPVNAIHLFLTRLGAGALVPSIDQFLGVQGIVHIIDTVLEPDESSIEPEAIHTALTNLEDGQRVNWEAESAGNTKQSRSFPLSHLLNPCTSYTSSLL